MCSRVRTERRCWPVDLAAVLMDPVGMVGLPRHTCIGRIYEGLSANAKPWMSPLDSCVGWRHLSRFFKLGVYLAPKRRENPLVKLAYARL